MEKHFVGAIPENGKLNISLKIVSWIHSMVNISIAQCIHILNIIFEISEHVFLRTPLHGWNVMRK